MFCTKYPLSLFLVAAVSVSLASFSSCKKEKVLEPEKKEAKVEMSSHRMRDEQRANHYLEIARQEMSDSDFTAARATIEEMRDSCYLALDARERAILLLDSIELMAARADNKNPDRETRIKFYQKKLEYDLEAPKLHESRKQP